MLEFLKDCESLEQKGQLCPFSLAIICMMLADTTVSQLILIRFISQNGMNKVALTDKGDEHTLQRAMNPKLMTP
ncbi:hypothetical protein [Vibrio gazogenes]|uniref:hypothetical protein n=1 Tax=Vibrio gazogenes TaxID=687 RepID=UPI0009334D5E|nr:hypothetical protein [Vibrio gazogenes]USP14762.1 hypothetical protein MKS89_05470 [Vibrio gazogenes]